MGRVPRWSQNSGGILAHAAGASVVPKRRTPRHPCGGGLGDRRPWGAGFGGPQADQAPSPMRRGPRWTQSGRGPLAHGAEASVVPKRRRPPRPRGVSLGGPKTEGAAAPMRRGPRWSQSGGRPVSHAAGVPVDPKRRRHPRPCGGVLSGPKVYEATSPTRPGPR